jgi:hypothetical protein
MPQLASYALHEKHPIQDSPPWSDADRIRHLELHLAMLWDHVWWLSLPDEKRKEYEAQGFTAPIKDFYERD